jgi:hypothetical protein
MMNSNGSLVWTRCDFRLHSTVTTKGLSAVLAVALFPASEAVGATCPINMLPHMVMTAIGYFIILKILIIYICKLYSIQFFSPSILHAKRMETAELPGPCRLRGAKSLKLKAESKCTTNN